MSDLVYVVVEGTDYEGYGSPKGVFSELPQAIAFATTLAHGEDGEDPIWRPDWVDIYARELNSAVEISCLKDDPVWCSSEELDLPPKYPDGPFASWVDTYTWTAGTSRPEGEGAGLMTIPITGEDSNFHGS